MFFACSAILPVRTWGFTSRLQDVAPCFPAGVCSWRKGLSCTLTSALAGAGSQVFFRAPLRGVGGTCFSGRVIKGTGSHTEGEARYRYGLFRVAALVVRSRPFTPPAYRLRRKKRGTGPQRYAPSAAMRERGLGLGILASRLGGKTRALSAGWRKSRGGQTLRMVGRAGRTNDDPLRPASAERGPRPRFHANNPREPGACPKRPSRAVCAREGKRRSFKTCECGARAVPPDPVPHAALAVRSRHPRLAARRQNASPCGGLERESRWTDVADGERAKWADAGPLRPASAQRGPCPRVPTSTSAPGSLTQPNAP